MGAFGTGFSIQVFENNGLVAEEGSRFRDFSEQGWIQNNPGYNFGVFAGKLSGIIQAGGEYFASATIFTGGNGLSIAASPATGGASLAGSPAATATAAAVAVHGTLVWQSSIQSFATGSNYGTSSNSPWEIDNRLPFDRETVLSDNTFKKTSKNVKGATVYKKNGKQYHRDTLHKGKGSHLEVYDKTGKHLGEGDLLTGEIKPNTADPRKKLPK
ncbi:hypothetical protein RU86_GL000617 [Lactococcus piscium]|uniref:Uncharacterized protein n=1 Tax=Pseudolactococcus piscium TaxID=1364 RepID=A0A2A5RWN9_9LACT|nr:hypothetical protein RU86_GL000617 [Lactococcus piscium]